MDFIALNFGLVHKTSSKVLINTTFEFCESYHNLNPFLKAIINTINNYQKDSLHECPYYPQKRMGVESFPIDNVMPMLSMINFQRGDYKLWVQSRDKKNKLINYIRLTFAISAAKLRKKT